MNADDSAEPHATPSSGCAWSLLLLSAGGIQLVLLIFYPGFPWLPVRAGGSPGVGYGAAYGTALGALIFGFIALIAVAMLAVIGLSAFVVLVNRSTSRQRSAIVFVATAILTCVNAIGLMVSRDAAWQHSNRIWLAEMKAMELEKKGNLQGAKQMRDTRDRLRAEKLQHEQEINRLDWEAKLLESRRTVTAKKKARELRNKMERLRRQL